MAVADPSYSLLNANVMDIHSMPLDSPRKYDVVVFGVTGFTGQFVAEELHRLVARESHNVKWAVAGRNKTKIEAILNGL